MQWAKRADFATISKGLCRGVLDSSDRIMQALKGVILQLIYFEGAYHRKKREQAPEVREASS
jgi:hypothetical protein